MANVETWMKAHKLETPSLACRYGERVLIPPRDSDPNPNVWDLVTADEAARRVHGVVQDDDEAIVLDEDTLG